MSPYVYSEGREAFNGKAFFSALPSVGPMFPVWPATMEQMKSWRILHIGHAVCCMVGATFEEGRGSGKCAGEVKLFPRACRAHVRAA